MNTRTLLLASLLFCACTTASDKEGSGTKSSLPPGAEARSLAGEPLFPPFLSPAERKKKEDQLADARASYEADPSNPDALIWFGRRTANLGRYNDAVTIFSEGIAKHPNDPRMFRHRGHRWITLRQFDRAIDDLTRAAKLVENRPDEIEPAVNPNAQNADLETLNQNVYYHLALAYYLKGDFEKALPNWRNAMRFSENPDSLCSGTHWTYMTLRRMGRTEEAQKLLAPITKDMPIIEYFAYHRMLLVYKGELDPDQLLEETRTTGKSLTDYPTIGYGVGNWHLYNGRSGRAYEVFARIADTEMWPAFGRIAAEAELTRAKVTQP
jgi:tetratricopeptide (TPR) repeat protein